MVEQYQVVEYQDREGKTRWGYLIESDYNVLSSLWRSGERSDARVVVYLQDGTTGDASLSDLQPVAPFAPRDTDLQIRPPQPIQENVSKDDQEPALKIIPSGDVEPETSNN